jgi:hypothetical protein
MIAKLKLFYIKIIETTKVYILNNWKSLILFIIWDLSGLRFVFEMIKPRKNGFNKSEPSKLLIWIISIYIASWGLAMTKYELKNNNVYYQLSTVVPFVMDKAEENRDYSVLIGFQRELSPIEPNIFSPKKVFFSLTEVKKETSYKVKETITKSIVVNKSYLSSAILCNADLYNADLCGANLSNANLTNVNLTNANLYNADMSGCNFLNVNLTNAYLSNTDISKAKNLTIAQLEKAKTLYKAKFSKELLDKIKNQIPSVLRLK